MKKLYVTLILLTSVHVLIGQVVNIPDQNFSYLLTYYNCVDTNGDGVADARVDTNGDQLIQLSEAQGIDNLSIPSYGNPIASLEGLQYFVNLTSLSIVTDIGAINVAPLTQLTKLQLSGVTISSLNLNQNVNLEEVTFNNGVYFGILNLSNLANLDKLTCRFSGVSDIVLHPNANLTEMNITSLSNSNNYNLDLTQHTNLRVLESAVNSISNIDLSNNINLEILDLGGNDLTSIDLSNNVNLIQVDISGNELTTADFSQNLNLTKIDVELNDMTSINISQNNALIDLDLRGNYFTSLDVSNNPNLEILDVATLIAAPGTLATLDISQNLNLKKLMLRGQDLTSLDISQHTALETLDLYGNLFTQLDASNNPNLGSINLTNNNLNWLNVKNGYTTSYNNTSFPNFFTFLNNPNLSYICADDEELDFLATLLSNSNYTNVNLNTFCSFVPGGDYYSIAGQGILDLNGDGCDNTDVIAPYLKLIVDNGSEEGIFYSYGQNGYSIALEEGYYEVALEVENPDFFQVTPASFQIDLPSNFDPYVQDFCLTPLGVFNKLEITLIPLTNARPGFDADYKIIYRNIGTTVLSGTLNLNFEGNVLDLVQATPIVSQSSENNVNWDYTDLVPFESRIIYLTMNLNTPSDTPPLNGGDFLSYLAYSTPEVSDGTPIYVAFGLSQELVNSFDPNDKTCLQGPIITTDQVGEYLHYMIRFENTGSANATNIVVTDLINTNKFDISTLKPLDGSHEFETRIVRGNEVQFIFENIELPFDDANNDGYVVFKIKTLASLQEGDEIENGSEIYFDFNAPIITNTATTLISDALSVADINAHVFNIFPNPTHEVLNIKSNTMFKQLTLTDINGRVLKLMHFETPVSSYQLNLADLNGGIYFLTIASENASYNKKIIKR